ncbi:MAG: ADP-ribosylglycohydrolase family protein [Anaerolineales bacterium]|jgi:ADP-ribosylglycohydrolase
MNRKRFSGCIIGQCLGDALGFPVEGFPPRVCQRYVEEYLANEEMPLRGRGPFRFGQYTDDSQLARELMLSYVERQGFDPQDYARRIAAIFKEKRIVGRGRATDQAACRLAAGVPWQEAGTPPPSAGNGSAMRAAPIGLFFYDSPEELIKAADDQGRITHADRRCSAGAVAIAGSVALALKNQAPTESWLDQLAEWVMVIDEAFGQHILQLRGWIQLAPADAVVPISKCGVDPGYEDAWEGISPFVVGSVLWSLYSFLRSPEDYMETIRTSIVVSGDVDTTAAMAGAISGAYLGIEAVPPGLARHVTDQGAWGYSDLVDLAHRCYEVKCGETSLGAIDPDQ